MNPTNPLIRRYLQTTNMRAEAAAKLKDYDAIMANVEQELEAFRKTGIPCKAFTENEDDEPEVIEVTRQCWNHVFKHRVKRQSKVEKLERALAFPSALKLLHKTTTYQGVSVETWVASKNRHQCSTLNRECNNIARESPARHR